MSDPIPGAFERAGAEKNASLVVELFQFMKHHKKFWLLPLVIVLFGMGLFIVLGGTAAAPFIYPLF